MSLLLKRDNSNNHNVPFRKPPILREQAIEIDPPEDAISIDEDVEAALATSSSALMYNFEVERPISIVASIKESARSSTRKAKYYCSYVTRPIRKLLVNFKLLIIIGIYSFLGAHLFMHLEVENDLEEREEAFHKRHIARENMILDLRAIFYDNREDREERWKQAINAFEKGVNLDEPSVDTAWTFWMSFLYAGTIFTTIGYGNIFCKTRAGQIATMIYAFVGIPIMLVMLTSLNNLLLKWIKIIANTASDFMLYIGVRLGYIVIQQNEIQKRYRYTTFAKKMKQWGLAKNALSTTIAVSVSEEERIHSKNAEEEDEEQEEPDPPVISTLFATIGWIMLSAWIFCLFEDWSFFKSFYFCFISLTTVGLGDVVPENPQYMIATFGVVLVGLSMITVCIDVIKEKIALMYMALLRKLLKEYMDALESGDPNAASAMMAGFQGKAKFLMPLISKNEGAKVMNKFKSDCSKKGIDLPHVLTDINPETGMPAFANAAKEDFNDYIDVAEEKFADEQQKIAQTPTPKSPTLEVNSFQTSSQVFPETAIVRKSLEVQAGTSLLGKLVNLGSQAVVESSDEGIQTDYNSDIDDLSTRVPETIIIPAPKPETSEIGTQYDIVSHTTIGIQPELSSIFLHAEVGDSDEDYGCSIQDEDSVWDSDEWEGSEVDDTVEALPKDLAVDFTALAHGLQSPPIEITASLSDDEHPVDIPERKNMHLLSLARLEKSASMDSADTVIHITPDELKEKNKLISSPLAKTKKSSTKKRRKRRGEHELRFLKNCGNQVTPILLDCATQYEVFTRETSSQHIPIQPPRSRKCQTKLSSINQEQLKGIRETLRRRESQMTNASEASSSRKPRESFSRMVSESESVRSGIMNNDVAEISLDLNFIALGVDESGKVIDQPGAVERVGETVQMRRSRLKSGSGTGIISESESESYYDREDPGRVGASTSYIDLDDWDDEDLESLDDLELFTMDAFAQTEEKGQADKNVAATLLSLDIMKDETTQTTINTIQKIYPEPSTSVETNEFGIQTETESEDRTEPETSDISSQTQIFIEDREVQTSSGDFEPDPVKAEMLEGFSQTEDRKLEDLDVQTDNLSDTACSSCQTDDPPPVIRNGTAEMQIQTELDDFVESTAFQTESTSLAHSDAQTDQPSLHELEMQTEATSSKHIDSQTDRLEYQESEIQTDDLTDLQETGIQTKELDLHQSGMQTEPTTSRNTSMQTDGSYSQEDEIHHREAPDLRESDMQTDSVTSQAVDIQTDNPSCHEVDLQTDRMNFTEADVQTDNVPSKVVDSEEVEIQTEKSDLQETNTQTDAVTSHVAENQTEGPEFTEVEMQTSLLSFDNSEVQTETMEYTEMEIQTNIPSFNSSEVQTDDPQIQFQTIHCQTEKSELGGYEEAESQTSVPTTASESQTDEPEMPDIEDQLTQTEVVLIDQETQFDVTEFADKTIEAIEETATSSTQPDPTMIDTKSCQTENVMVNKRSQINLPGQQISLQDHPSHSFEVSDEISVDNTLTEIETSLIDIGIQIEVDRKSVNLSPIALEFSHSFTMTESEDGIEKEVQVEESCFDELKGPEEYSHGPLWSDFDYVPVIDEFGNETDWVDEETQTIREQSVEDHDVEEEVEGEAVEEAVELPSRKSSRSKSEYESTQKESESEIGVQVAPSYSEISVQTVKFKRKPKERAEKYIEAVVETSDSTVQATPETSEISVGEGDEDEWLQVYVQELDEERRLRMSDIGIQTGVLARVQHIYTRPISDEVSTTASAPITLRKSSDSSEQLSIKYGKNSDDSLATHSTTESMDDRLWTERSSPFSSRPSSTKRPHQSKDPDRKIDRSNLVQDLMARFEVKSPTPSYLSTKPPLPPSPSTTSADEPSTSKDPPPKEEK